MPRRNPQPTHRTMVRRDLRRTLANETREISSVAWWVVRGGSGVEMDGSGEATLMPPKGLT